MFWHKLVCICHGTIIVFPLIIKVTLYMVIFMVLYFRATPGLHVHARVSFAGIPSKMYHVMYVFTCIIPLSLASIIEHFPDGAKSSFALQSRVTPLLRVWFVQPNFQCSNPNSATCMIWNKMLHLSVHQFPHLCSEEKNTSYLMGLIPVLHEQMYVTHWAPGNIMNNVCELLLLVVMVGVVEVFTIPCISRFPELEAISFFYQMASNYRVLYFLGCFTYVFFSLVIWLLVAFVSAASRSILLQPPSPLNSMLLTTKGL